MHLKARKIQWAPEAPVRDIAWSFHALQKVAPHRARLDTGRALYTPTQLSPDWFTATGDVRNQSVDYACTRGWQVVAPGPIPIALDLSADDAILVSSESRLAHLLDDTSYRTLYQAGLFKQPRVAHLGPELASVHASTVEQLSAALFMYCQEETGGLWSSIGMPDDPAAVGALLIIISGVRFLVDQCTLDTCEISLTLLQTLAAEQLIGLRMQRHESSTTDAAHRTWDGRATHTTAIA